MSRNSNARSTTACRFSTPRFWDLTSVIFLIFRASSRTLSEHLSRHFLAIYRLYSPPEVQLPLHPSETIWMAHLDTTSAPTPRASDHSVIQMLWRQRRMIVWC